MKCFVISPIGQPGSPTRENAEDIYECVIRPALKLARIEGSRADHKKDIGRISEQMFEAILGADFCIAVLAGYNPNVFYEIAVAHSAGIPVVLLCEKGVDPPFDLKDHRAFHYDLSPRMVLSGANAQRLAEQIETIRALNGRRTVPFGENLAPLNAAPAEQAVTIVKETQSPAAFWKSHVDTAKERYYIAGIALNDWRGNPGMPKALRDAAQRGVEIRFITMHGENPALAVMLNARISDHTSHEVGALAEGVRKHFRSILADFPNAKVRAIRNGTLHQQIIIVDDRSLVTPFHYSSNTGRSPRIDAHKGSGLYEAALREFNALWNMNPRADAPKAVAKAAAAASRKPPTKKPKKRR